MGRPVIPDFPPAVFVVAALACQCAAVTFAYLSARVRNDVVSSAFIVTAVLAAADAYLITALHL